VLKDKAQIEQRVRENRRTGSEETASNFRTHLGNTYMSGLGPQNKHLKEHTCMLTVGNNIN
jgi:hypothetical protein